MRLISKTLRPSQLVAMGLAVVVAAPLGCKKDDDRPVATKPSKPVAAPAQNFKLVVIVIVDQLPSWTFTSDAALMKGGIGRLLSSGAYFVEAEFPYAATYTAPGHAAIGTGATPAVNGILANSWFRKDLNRRASAVADPDATTFVLAGEPPTEKQDGASAKSLLVEGVADVLRAQKPGAKSVAVGLKQRASILMLGQLPDLALWYDPDQPAMTTSSYYVDAPPDWLVALAKDQPVSRFFDYEWTPLDADLLEQTCVGPDDGPGEGKNEGLDTTFPHPLKGLERVSRALRATPAGTELVLDSALAALEGEGLGADATTDLLAVTLSSHDYAGHYWGQESWERLDLLLQLDISLGKFFDQLDEKVGKNQYAVILTSDHGAAPMVERSVKQGKDAHRITHEMLKKAANTAANTILGPGEWVADFAAGTVYLSGKFDGLPSDKRSRALDAIVTGLRKAEGVGYAKRTDEFGGQNCDDMKDPLDKLACRAIRPGRSGAVYCAPGHYSLTSSHIHKSGTGHGSPNPEDRVVPVIVSVPGLAPSVERDVVSMLRVAPTIAKMLGVPPPSAAKEPPLY
jgi:predicted AlkP superfamily pyrophosphatase or phosphodiesterase